MPAAAVSCVMLLRKSAELLPHTDCGTLWQGTCQAILVCRNDDAVGLLGGTLHHLTPLLVHLQLGSALAQLRHREIKCTCILGLSMCNLGLRTIA